MENSKEVALDILVPDDTGGSLIGVYLKIIFAPVAFFVVFALGYFDIISLKVELHSIVMMAFLLLIALIVARHNAEYGCRLFEDRIEVFKKNLKDYIMSHLIVIGNRKKSNAGFDDFVEEFVRDIRNENYSRVASGVFPMLGILGTFISIAISMPEFSSTNIDGLETEIAQLLGGVGTAFYISIYGIFLALWWIYFEKRGMSRFEKLLFKYKNATRNFFWQNEEITQGLLVEIISKSERTTNILNNAFQGDFSENFTSALNAKFANFKSIIELEESSIKSANSKLVDISNILARSAEIEDSFNKNQAKIISSIDSLAKNIAIIQSNLSKEYKDMIAHNNSKIEQLDELTTAFSKALFGFEQNLSSVKQDINDTYEKSNAKFQKVISDEIAKLKGEFDEYKDSDNTDLVEELKLSLENIDDKINIKND
ncbi:MAG: MotA/TolQ/ExbB proton channel family protein [Campylobacter sp.]|nr:MotA/TolQ/ExbB proton channel family protein [Campylobacter sp.]